MIVAVTGHRPDKLGGYNTDASAKLENIMTRWLMQNKQSLSIEKVITGMALGWDQAVARACINAKIPFIAAVPFKGQDTMWPDVKQVYYKWLLDQAAEVKMVSSGWYTAKKMQKRNAWMVDNSDLLVAMWDGSEGGTYNCVKYATEHNKEIINLIGEFKYPAI